jgi:hypothetical protein
MSTSFAVGADSFLPGTDLSVDRLSYRHHAIYLGDGLVIHYAGRPSRFSPACPPGPVVRELRAVCGGRG